jgi:hypothetical protein
MKVITKSCLYDEFNQEFDCCRPVVHTLANVNSFGWLRIICPVCKRRWWVTKDNRKNPTTGLSRIIEDNETIPFGWELETRLKIDKE